MEELMRLFRDIHIGIVNMILLRSSPERQITSDCLRIMRLLASNASHEIHQGDTVTISLEHHEKAILHDALGFQKL